MNSRSKPDTKVPISTQKLVVLGLLGALLLVIQIALAPLPNIELVSLCVILYAHVFGRKAFYAIYTFVLLEGLIYGFGIWWISYLYIWSLLAIVVMLFPKLNQVLPWALIAGFFGLFFGLLCSIPYLITGGIYAAFSYWVAGLGFDIIHCVSNFILTILLYKPLHNLLIQLSIRGDFTHMG